MNPIRRENVVPFHDQINKFFLGLLTIGLCVLPMTGIPHNTSYCPDGCYQFAYLSMAAEYSEESVWLNSSATCSRA